MQFILDHLPIGKFGSAVARNCFHQFRRKSREGINHCFCHSIRLPVGNFNGNVISCLSFSQSSKAGFAFFCPMRIIFGRIIVICTISPQFPRYRTHISTQSFCNFSITVLFCNIPVDNSVLPCYHGGSPYCFSPVFCLCRNFMITQDRNMGVLFLCCTRSYHSPWMA